MLCYPASQPAQGRSLPDFASLSIPSPIYYQHSMLVRPPRQQPDSTTIVRTPAHRIKTTDMPQSLRGYQPHPSPAFASTNNTLELPLSKNKVGCVGVQPRFFAPKSQLCLVIGPPAAGEAVGRWCVRWCAPPVYPSIPQILSKHMIQSDPKYRKTIISRALTYEKKKKKKK